MTTHVTAEMVGGPQDGLVTRLPGPIPAPQWVYRQPASYLDPHVEIPESEPVETPKTLHRYQRDQHPESHGVWQYRYLGEIEA